MQLAYLDSLTGVFNRRMGLIILEWQLQFAKRLGSPLTICYLDIDGLKEVNDRYGHSEGDNLIKMLSKTIGESIREQDSLCRLGGDEFLVIQPKCTIEKTKIVRKRLDESFKRLNRDHPRPYRYAASYGFAEYLPDMEVSVDKLIDMADAAMYQEKMKCRDSGQLQQLLET
jgi:diguanylate cyclase (GGDEF)-like protein